MNNQHPPPAPINALATEQAVFRVIECKISHLLAEIYPIKKTYLKIVNVVYGKRLISNTLFTIKTKSFTVKCFANDLFKILKTTYRDTLFNYRNMDMLGMCKLTYGFYNWTARQAHSGSLQMSGYGVSVV